jgi:hypothetical protein
MLGRSVRVHVPERSWWVVRVMDWEGVRLWIQVTTGSCISGGSVAWHIECSLSLSLSDDCLAVENLEVFQSGAASHGGVDCRGRLSERARALERVAGAQPDRGEVGSELWTQSVPAYCEPQDEIEIEIFPCLLRIFEMVLEH